MEVGRGALEAIPAQLVHQMLGRDHYGQFQGPAIQLFTQLSECFCGRIINVINAGGVDHQALDRRLILLNQSQDLLLEVIGIGIEEVGFKAIGQNSRSGKHTRRNGHRLQVESIGTLRIGGPEAGAGPIGVAHLVDQREDHRQGDALHHPHQRHAEHREGSDHEFISLQSVKLSHTPYVDQFDPDQEHNRGEDHVGY